MGFFSWITADTNESIPAYASGLGKTVYLLQPKGEPPIKEEEYEGYGEFGGVDAHEWVARRNVPAKRLAGLSDEEVRLVGISLHNGGYYLDSETGAKLSIFHFGHDVIDPEIKAHYGTYNNPVRGYGGKTANELIKESRLVSQAHEIALPLKFSFSPDAVYEDLPASKDCPDQGFFYGADGDEDDEDDGDVIPDDTVVDDAHP